MLTVDRDPADPVLRARHARPTGRKRHKPARADAAKAADPCSKARTTSCSCSASWAACLLRHGSLKLWRIVHDPRPRAPGRSRTRSRTLMLILMGILSLKTTRQGRAREERVQLGADPGSGLPLRRHLHDHHPRAGDPARPAEHGALAGLIRAVHDPVQLLLGHRRPLQLPGQRAHLPDVLQHRARRARRAARARCPACSAISATGAGNPRVHLRPEGHLGRRRVHGRQHLHRQRAELHGQVHRRGGGHPDAQLLRLHVQVVAPILVPVFVS